MMNPADGKFNVNSIDGMNFDHKDSNNSSNKIQERYVWEIRSPNITPATTVLNSPDIADINYSMHLQQHQKIRVGRSPVTMQDESNNLIENNQHLTSTGSPTDLGQAGINLVREGEIVVFDDIDTNWIMKSDKTQLNLQNDDVLKVTKMIGQLPIAEYEGSPRRIGKHEFTSHNNYNRNNSGLSPTSFPRPGFPQRISPTVTQEFNNQQQQNHDSNLIDMDDKSSNENFNSESKEINKPKTPTFDYLYEFSETRKVLEEFFQNSNSDEIDKKFSDFAESDEIASSDTNQDYNRSEEKKAEQAYIGQRLARIPNDEFMVHRSPKKQIHNNRYPENDIELYSNSRSSGGNEYIDQTEIDANLRRHSRNFTLSPETTDYDSNCGDLDSLSNDLNLQTDFGKLYTSMPVLEDGLSSGHASDTENNFPTICIEKNYLELASVENMEKNSIRINNKNNEGHNMNSINNTGLPSGQAPSNQIFELTNNSDSNNSFNNRNISNNFNPNQIKENNIDIYSTNLNPSSITPPPPPAPAPHRQQISIDSCDEIQEAIKDIRSALQRTKALQEKSTPLTTKYCDEILQGGHESPVWIPRCSSSNDNEIEIVNNKKEHEDEEADTDLETDRLLGQQRLDDHGFYDENSWKAHLTRLSSPNNHSTINSILTSTKPKQFSSATIRHGVGTELTSPSSPENCKIIGSSEITITSPEKLQFTKISPTASIKSKKDSVNGDKKSKTRSKEALLDPAVLIEGVLFRARYLGSTQLVCEGQPTKSTRMMQAEEAVSRIKAPDGESQPSTEVDLFISTEKIMVLNTDLKEIMMDHALRTISYIADIGDLVVLMARRRFIPPDNSEENVKPNRTPKMICHVFESDEAQFIAQSIGQAFQVAYMEFLKANGIEDHSFVKEMDYQEVLNSQEIFGDELEIFAKKELQKEVVVPKAKGEILGVVIVESGWGSMLPTVVIANLMSTGAAARCGQLNIGDQLIAINGLSLVGLPLSTCQTYIRNTKNQTAVKFTVVPCPPVVEVKIKRPNTKYQLGFSVQNGVICSLLRGGIAERGGVRVGHRIIEINNQSVVAVPHEKIVNLLATSVGEILMKTMPTSMFRLLTGQENPIYI